MEYLEFGCVQFVEAIRTRTALNVVSGRIWKWGRDPQAAYNNYRMSEGLKRERVKVKSKQDSLTLGNVKWTRTYTKYSESISIYIIVLNSLNFF